MDFGGRMPSPPLNVHWRPGRAGQPDHAKRRDLIDALALLIWATRSAHRGNDTTRKTTEASSRVAREQGNKNKGVRCRAVSQAETDCVCRVFSSSNAAEMSRILITPIRLCSSMTGR